MLATPVRRLFHVLIAALVLSVLAAASDSADRFQMNRDLRIEADEKVGDVSCLNCSIHIRGQVAGDVFALHGNVVIETGAQVSGDVSTLVGDVRVESGASVAGEIAAIAGAVRRQPQAVIAGEVSSMEGTQWLLLITLGPLMMLALIVGLIVWLVQRSRPPRAAAA